MTAAQGIVLVLDSAGAILEIPYNSVGIEVHQGDFFLKLVHPASAVKALHFLEAIRANSGTFNWRFDFQDAGTTVNLYFAGAKQKDHLMIVAELMPDSGSESNRPINNDLYEDFSRLNNVLTTTQRELAKKNSELERMNQLKDRFLGTVAHDLRNPISIIRSYSEYLLEEAHAGRTEDETRILRTMVSSSDFMLALVNDLLDIAKIESGRLDLSLRPLDLGEALAHNVDLQQSLANKKQQTIDMHIEPGVPLILADARKIEQVFNNLIGNAVKFSPIGGVIEINLLAKDQKVSFSVRDHGPGIASEHIDKIFEPFATAGVDPSAGEKSTGLGLAIVKRIIDGHGGKMSVSSQPGAGSTFTVIFPQYSPSQIETSNTTDHRF